MREQPEHRSSRGWPIAIAIICVGLFTLAGFVFKSCLDQPSQLASTISEAARPQVTVSTIIQTSLERLKAESKLVVYTADIAVMVTKFSEKKVLYGKIDLGTTTVRVRASGNKAQWIIPLDTLAAGNFEFSEGEKQLTITLSPPRVDETLVEVQTDPTFYEIQTEIGWARLDSYSGDFLREQARRELRPAVISEASQPRILEMAKQSGRGKISGLIESAIKPLRPDISVKVEFNPEVEEVETNGK